MSTDVVVPEIVEGGVSVFKIVPPQDGGWSLMPMENLLRGLRDARETISLELFGVDGVIHYGARTAIPRTMGGMFSAYFPQADVSSHRMGAVPGEAAEQDLDDWLRLGEDEFAVVQTLGLRFPGYLPLRVFDDREIHNAETDPLAGLIGVISSDTAYNSSRGADRLGVRLLLRPAPEDWSSPWQNRMQARRDGEDREVHSSSSAEGGMGSGAILSLAGLAGIAGINWLFYSSGNVLGMVLLNGLVASLGLAAFGIRRRFFGGRRRPYLDEPLMEEKLKSLGFWTELQIVRTYRKGDDRGRAMDGVNQVIHCLRSFDDPAGNSWEPGPVFRYEGGSVAHREYGAHSGGLRLLDWLTARDHDFHPFVGGSQILSWLVPRRARSSVLSAREAASIWHLPLGMSEMASMERIASGSLVPYLGALSSGDEDSGPLVGKSGEREIRLPESSIEKHAVVLGRSGVGKSTLIKHIVHYKLLRKAAGKDDGAIVVIDPHADMVREILTLVPNEIAHKVRLLDFGRIDRVPGINLVDPNLFPDRDRCVDTIVNTVRHLWEHWGGRLEDLLKNSLLIIYEFNSSSETRPEEMLTMLDILSLLQDGVPEGRGKDATVEMSTFQRKVLRRVRDPRLKQWFQMYMNWPRDTRSEAVGPVQSRIGAYAANKRASVVMGQRESTIMLSDVLSEGLVLLVSTAQGTIGKSPAALMGGTIVSLVESALRAQENLDPSERAKCLLVCDEFQTVTGAPWEDLFAEIRKYGCSMMLATQSLARLDTQERHLRAGILANVGVIVAYQMAAEEARIISAEMDVNRVPEHFLVNLNPHHCCVRINSSTTCYPAFSMKTLPPPEMGRSRAEADAAVQAVLNASREYTVDFDEVRARLDREYQVRLDGGEKAGTIYEAIGGSGVPPAGDDDGLAPDDLVPDDVAEVSSARATAETPAETWSDDAGPASPDVSVDDADTLTGDPFSSGPEVSAPAAEVPEPEVSAPEVSAPEVSAPAAEVPAPVSEVSAPVSETRVSPGSKNSGSKRRRGSSGGMMFPPPPGAGDTVERLVSQGVSAESIEKSGLTPDALDYISVVGAKDPALRELVNKNNRHHVSKAYKTANKDVESRMERAVEERVAEESASIYEKAYSDAMVASRAELVADIAEPSEGGSRDLGQLRRRRVVRED